MSCVPPRLFQGRPGKLLLVLSSAILFLGLTSVASRGQRTKAPVDGPEDKPALNDFRGVRIGMATDEARKKLGNPRDKSAEQDFYVFNDTQAVQIFYDKAGMVSAISIDFMTGATGIPTPKEVLGTEADAKPDGSQYKMMRYPKAGYWVSYSRTAGTSPTTTITMQKIEH